MFFIISIISITMQLRSVSDINSTKDRNAIQTSVTPSSYQTPALHCLCGKSVESCCSTVIPSFSLNLQISDKI